MKFLVVGLGGIGQRHTRNLRGLLGDSCDIIAYRVRRASHVLSDALQVEAPEGLEGQYGIRSFDQLDKALAERPDAALICNPTSMHMEVALQAAESGCHLLIEKPLSHTVDGIGRLEALAGQHKLVCMIAYQMRFHPCLTMAHRLFTGGAIGRAIACRAAIGEYLPGWHRYEDYRTMYAARRALGGGVVLSQIHELDILYWFFGRPRHIVSVGGHFSDLEIDVEDVASTLFSYDGMIAHLHQDFVQQPPMRQIEIIGSAGKISIDLRAPAVHAYDGAGKSIASQSFEGFERNTLFTAELQSFINAIKTRGAVPVDLAAARQSLEMALAIRRSIETRAPVDMSASQ